QNIGALSGFPIGKLSDRYGRRSLLACGCAVAIIANVCFGLVHSVMGVMIGAALWGVQMSVTQTLFQAMIADTIDPDLRGTGFGIYYLVTGFSLFVANVSMGFVFETYGSTVAFSCSAIIAFASVLLTGLLPRTALLNKSPQL
ncbi:MAG: MFS transporter, partial [Verrucomicrobia bacterium]|nr:MFS transporter [Verrucomicrobiota bacterium]